MLKRIFTSLIGLVVFFAVVFMHRYVLYTAAAILMFCMLYEMYTVISTGRTMRISGYVSAAAIYAGVVFGKTLFAVYAVFMLFLFDMIILHGRVTSKKVLFMGFVTAFIALFMSLLIPIRANFGCAAVILPFVCAWMTDTGAYFTGSFIGKHKLVPHISPKKTIEGAVGGIVLATLGCIVYAAIADPSASYFRYALLGLAGSVISQAGDLTASCIKRDFGKKDYGSVLPGHGGIMDRFDSVLYVLPFVYFALRYFI